MLNSVSRRDTYMKSSETATTVRADYIIALIPAVIWSFIRFGVSAFLLITISVLFSALTDFIIKLFINYKLSYPSAYSIYCGLFFSLTLYSQTSIIIAAIGGFLCSFICFVLGGEGKTLFFAPLAARLIAFAFFPGLVNEPPSIPINLLLQGKLPDQNLFEFILGATDGCIGAVSVIAILIGALYLTARHAISLTAPLSYIIGSAVLIFVFPLIEGRTLDGIVIELFASELLLSAFFAIGDYSIAPQTTNGRLIYGFGCAACTLLLRKAGMDSAAFTAVLIMNSAAVVINNVTSQLIVKSVKQ